MKSLKEIKLFMLDMDGTIYHEDELIPGALEFFGLLNEHGIPYVFMTNNSSRSKADYVSKLNRLGIKAGVKNITSSADALIRYLRRQGEGRNIYLAGTESLRRELSGAGFRIMPEDYRGSDIDFAVLGFDTELTYGKIAGLCYYVSRGYPYVATNCDLKCPVREGKFIPDCGAIAEMISHAAGRMPVFVGKPDREMIDSVSAEWNIPNEYIACIGDRLYTDIAAAVNAGAVSVCVLTGEADREEISASEIKPDYCFGSIMNVYEEVR